MDGPFPSVVTYGSTAAALRRGGHWQHALQLLERAQDQKVGGFCTAKKTETFFQLDIWSNHKAKQSQMIYVDGQNAAIPPILIKLSVTGARFPAISNITVIQSWKHVLIRNRCFL